MLGDKQTHAGNGYAGEREGTGRVYDGGEKKVVDGQGLGALTARLGRCRFGEKVVVVLVCVCACARAYCLWLVV